MCCQSPQFAVLCLGFKHRIQDAYLFNRINELFNTIGGLCWFDDASLGAVSAQYQMSYLMFLEITVLI